MIRDDIKTALITAMKAKEQTTVGTLRLIQSAIKNRDIEARTGASPADDDALVSEVLQKMAKQRRESIAMFEQGNRPELAAAEAAEIAVIERFLPKQMDEAESAAAIAALVAEAGATSVKDMGRVMALVKERLAGKTDMSRASAQVKAALS
jgi:uncharacterized protein